MARLVSLALMLTLSACLPTPHAAPEPVHSSTGRSATAATSAATSLAADASCRDEAAALPLAQQVGQLFMVAVTPDDADPAPRVARSGVGGVVLLGDWSGQEQVRASVDAMTKAVPTLLVATDQEGGRVQRLTGAGFETIPTAPRQAALGDAGLTEAAARWGTQLRDAGVRYDLAPVADVVPASKATTNQPIGVLRRGYSADPEVVGSRTAAFVTGMRQASVATSLKHFPNLGEVTGDPDTTAVTDTVTTRTSPAVAAFRPGIEAGASSVMVSSAVYAKIDPDAPAVFSTVVVTDMLRGDLGFTGVIVSDDLGVAQAVAAVPPADRALRFFGAGGDLLVNADPAIQKEMTDAVVAKAASDPAFATRVTDSAARVLALKSSVGIGGCRV